MAITYQQLKALLRGQSGAECAQLEHNPENALETPGRSAKKDPEPAAFRYTVEVVSYRPKLLDEDNLCVKFFVDALRYQGVIPNDSPDLCHIVSRQVKVPGKLARTELRVWRFPTGPEGSGCPASRSSG